MVGIGSIIGALWNDGFPYAFTIGMAGGKILMIRISLQTYDGGRRFSN